MFELHGTMPLIAICPRIFGNIQGKLEEFGIDYEWGDPAELIPGFRAESPNVPRSAQRPLDTSLRPRGELRQRIPRRR